MKELRWIEKSGKKILQKKLEELLKRKKLLSRNMNKREKL